MFVCLQGKQFAFRGCGWRNTQVSWTEEEKVWIRLVVDLFVKLFGEDYLKYLYSPDHGTHIEEVSDPRRSFAYDHDDWEASYENAINFARGANSVSSADSLKALASQLQLQASSADLDGISPIEADPLPANLENPVENESPRLSSVFNKTFSGDGSVEEVAIVFSTNHTGSTAVNPQRCRQQLLDVESQVQYGLLPSWSAPFQRITTCVLPSHESSRVDSLVEAVVPFQGSSSIDTTDLVSLRGCSPTSEENHLTNFVIEGYLELIAKQSVDSGQKVDFIGWERFEKSAGRQPAKDVLRGKAPLLEQDVVLVPCNSQESKHWFLLTLLPKEQEIVVLDSMAGVFVKPSAKEAISKMWLLLEELDTSIDASDWNFYCNKPADIPQQQNDYDCGVYLCMYARCLVLQHPMPLHLASFRKIMVLELHEQKLQNLPLASICN